MDVCSNQSSDKSITYPDVKRDDSVVDNLHGVQIADPYRWLEDPDSSETKTMIERQNEITDTYISKCAYREEIKDELTDLWDYPKVGVPRKYGDFYYYFRNSGLQNQSVLYRKRSLNDKDNADETVFLDPNTFSEDGTVSLTCTSFNKEGTVLAYGISESGSDWFNVKFKKTDPNWKPDLNIENEVLEKVKFSDLSWTHDNLGVFYGSYKDAPTAAMQIADGTNVTSNEHQKLYYHRLGDSKSDSDVMCVEFQEHPKWRIDASVSSCGQYMICCPQEGTKNNLVYFAKLPKSVTPEKSADNMDIVPPANLKLNCIVDKFQFDYEYITNIGSEAVFRTNHHAPNGKLVKIDLEEGNEKYDNSENWKDLIPHHPEHVIEWASVVNENYLIICYMEDVKNILKVYNLKDGAYLTSLNEGSIGSVVEYFGRESCSEMFYKFSSITTPGVIFKVDFSETENEVKFKPRVYLETQLKGYDPAEFELEQVFYTSKDGKTRVPMFIAGKKGLKKDASAPCLLYGYGGFNISLTPSFSLSQVYFMKRMNGFLAIPNIRGGGEYGEKWHNGGRLGNKQNCFDDFQSAGEFLIKEKYTSQSTLAIKGGSNGGLLVGVCCNQRPDLFKAGIAAVGVMDMLRFHKFTIGYAWCSDYGNPDIESDFKTLVKYSPLHNISVPTPPEVQYPAMLLTAADHDDRVVPSHSLKFISQLQKTFRDVSKQTNPLLIRVDTKSGHGAGKPTSKVIDEISDCMAFLHNVFTLSS